MTKTKIIATLGPASSDRTTLRKMIIAGLDVARINFSHGDLQARLKAIGLIRELNRKYRRHIRLLGDLEGHRIRIGRLEKPIELKKNQIICLTKENEAGKDGAIPMDYPGSLKDIGSGKHIYIDDGNLDLVVKERTALRLRARVVVGGLLKERKGVNIPGARLDFSDITQKDKDDIRFCIRHRFDLIAQSFVRYPEDIMKVRSLTRKELPLCKIVAKIENSDGIKNIGGIITASDGIMIARGDLGVSIPIFKVPVIQKAIIKKCNRAGKFVITATQMLESMTENLRPTRAEVSDVANAIIDGSDYLMLSAETSVGRHPAETVRMMNEVIKYTEKH